MTRSTASVHPDSTQDDSASLWLWLFAVLALLAGLYGRFKGLGSAPLGVDEFYVARSVDNLLRTGLPEFLCGGYYNRGPLYQYLVGGLRVAGLSPELAGRWLSALCSLAVLPAAYLLGRRVHSRTVGLLAVIVLCLSVWEIEMARFARMYAPFQAIFLWYLLCFLRYAQDKNRQALCGMIALSLLGVLVWEGGALLGVLNLLPPLLRHKEGRLRREDYPYLAAMLVLFVLLYALAVIDLRTHADTPAYADWYRLAPTDPGSDALDALRIALPPGTLWMALAALPIAAWLASLRWTWSLRHRWLTACGLLLAGVAALAHQLLISAALLALLLLAGLIGWRELIERPARLYLASLVLSALYWLCVGFGTDLWMGGVIANAAPTQVAQIVLMKLFGFPNVIDTIVRPWGRTIPLWSLCVFGAFAGLSVAAVRRGGQTRTATGLVLIAVLVMLLAVSASGTERHETRYTFFLYPVLLVLAIVTAAKVMSRLSADKRVVGVSTGIAALSCFAAAEDFQPRHVAAIDSDAINFRVGMSPALIGHFYPHNDVRSAAAWLNEHVPAGDLVINGIPSLDQYQDRIDFTFLIDDDPRYEAFACNRGTVDRWSNRPLLYSARALDDRLQRHRVFLVTYPSQTAPLLDKARDYGWRVQRVWFSIDGGVNILSLRGPAAKSQPSVPGNEPEAQR